MWKENGYSIIRFGNWLYFFYIHLLFAIALAIIFRFVVYLANVRIVELALDFVEHSEQHPFKFQMSTHKE